MGRLRERKRSFEATSEVHIGGLEGRPQNLARMSASGSHNIRRFAITYSSPMRVAGAGRSVGSVALGELRQIGDAQPASH